MADTKLVSDSYQEQLRQMHSKPLANGSTWGATSCRSVYSIRDFVEKDGPHKTLLDYGSADGKFQFQCRRRGLLPDTEIVEYDPGIEGKEDNNIPCDFVMCYDVLEHIEPDMLEAVLADMQRCTKKKGLFQIAMSQAKQFLPDGRNAHLIIENEDWWIEKLGRYFNILESNVTSVKAEPWRKALVVYVEPKEKK